MHTSSPKRFAHPAWIEIDLDQFALNIRALKAYLPQKICLTIKANAYGHGLIPIAKMAGEEGVDYLGVAHSQEGAILREAGVTTPILVMGAIHEEQIPDLLAYDLEFTLASAHKAELVAAVCKKLGKTAKVHIEIETGMQRTGMRPETALKLIESLPALGHFELKGIYSHLAVADQPAQNNTTYMQLNLFQTLVDKVKQRYPHILTHIANSGGVLNYQQSHWDMVRCGLLLYGYGAPPNHPLTAKIKPFFSIKAKVAFFKVVEANQGISYGHTYHTHAQTHIITIPIGYGDGLRRSLSNKGHVLIHGKRYPIAGLICMDQFMVDIGKDSAYVGDEVVLIGHQGDEYISLEEMSHLVDTISYEILCGFNDRLPRLYQYHGTFMR